MDIKIKEEFRQQAERLHMQYPVVDAHLDLAGEILLRYQAGEKDVIRNHYLEHWKKAGITLLVSSVFIEDNMLPETGLRNALDQISALMSDLEGVSEHIRLVRNQAELEYCNHHGIVGILLYLEGLDCIGEDIRLLSVFHQLGMRGASLTWSRRNSLATGCCKAGERKQIAGGLSEAGLAAVKELERLSCFIDVSHLNDEGFDQIAAVAAHPFLATHSNARSVFESYRNLTDDQIMSLCSKGGIIGINGCTLIAGSHEQGNHLEMLCKHLEHIVKLAGSRHVGYGFDLCDSYGLAEPRLHFDTVRYDCLRNHSEMLLVTAALLQRGMPEEDVIPVIGSNFYHFFLRLLERV